VPEALRGLTQEQEPQLTFDAISVSASMIKLSRIDTVMRKRRIINTVFYDEEEERRIFNILFNEEEDCEVVTNIWL